MLNGGKSNCYFVTEQELTADIKLKAWYTLKEFKIMTHVWISMLRVTFSCYHTIVLLCICKISRIVAIFVFLKSVICGGHLELT